MNDFQTFSKAVHANYERMAKTQLFVVAADGIREAYIGAFPEGTDPIYKTATEHTCSCCFNFLKHLGVVVSVEGLQLTTVWQGLDHLPHPYNVVAAALDAHVRGLPIVAPLFTSESSYGAEHTLQKLPDFSVKRWNHFHGAVPKAAISKEPDKLRGGFLGTYQVFKRGLEELKPEAFATVLELIEAKNLYRGEEHLRSINAFKELQDAWIKAGKQDIFVWGHANSTAARFRNTVIGTLLTDLSDGVGLEVAVASFEKKVAPENYKRPTALITASMVKAAVEKIEALGYTSALERRNAILSDVSVNNVLWVNNSAKQQMKGGLTDLLMKEVASPKVSTAGMNTISITEFMDKLPNLSDMQILMRGNLTRNLVTLTTGQHADAARLFKWDNQFAWSYNGNLADTAMRQAVKERGGSVTGDFRFTHQWNYDKRNASLMDLHVFMPGCRHENGVGDTYGTTPNRVGWNARKHAKTGGVQDVDYTAPAPVGYVPVENITFPDKSKMPEGVYACKVHNWQWREPTKGGFKAEIEVGGEIYTYEYDSPLSHHQWVHVADVTLKDGQFTVDSKLPVGYSSKDVWGLKTETFVKVDTLMYSPNYWDGNSVGNRHYFFMIDACKSPDAARSIYNEFLSPQLEEHRKVLEVLGSKTMIQPSDAQLSGLGFSSTRSDSVIVKVTESGVQKTFQVNF